MNTFLWAVLVIFGLDVLGKVVVLAKQDKERNLAITPVELVLSVGMVIWAAFLLS